MKNKIKYILVLIGFLAQFSCTMELLPPDGLIREEFWKNKGDVEAVLMSAYQRFARMDRKLFVFGEARADMVIGNNNQNSDERDLSESNIYPDNKISNWADFYKIINNCNEVIKNAPLVQEVDKTFSDFERQGLVSEAYFLRSLAYFYLVRLYKEVPLMLDPNERDNDNFYLEKSTEETVLSQIVSDLEENRAYAPSGGFVSEEENKGRASKTAFDALLADIALWRFDYESTLSHIEKIEETALFSLLPDSRWFENYYPGNSLENIMEFQFNDAYGQYNHMFVLTFPAIGGEYIPSTTAVDLLSFDTSTELIRGEDASIKEYGEGNFIIWKYIGNAADGQSYRSSADNQSCNWIVYRYADILLMKAEALSQLGQFNEAKEIINAIRERAGMAAIELANSKAVYEDAIMEERAVELSFEGKRWFDILRMGRRNDFARKSKLVEIVVSNVPSTQKRILAVKLANPMGWYLPIYQKEIERNQLLVQNPYYEL